MTELQTAQVLVSVAGSIRETWLEKAASTLRRRMAAVGFESDVTTRVSCGWPHKHGMARKKRRLGECWDPKSSTSGVAEVFISPLLSDGIEVLATLAHELCHAIVGGQHRHRGPFVKAIRAIGLDGKPTATVAGEGFKLIAQEVLAEQGDYPHSAMDPQAAGRERKAVTQSTRMLKCECPECGYIARAARKWILDVGPPVCPACMVAMQAEGV